MQFLSILKMYVHVLSSNVTRTSNQFELSDSSGTMVHFDEPNWANN